MILRYALNRNRQALLLAGLIMGNVALALGAWAVREADTGPVSAAFWRMLLALPFYIVAAKIAEQRITEVSGRTLFFVGLGAASFALDLAAWHIGIGMTRLGNATLFGNAGSVLLLFWGFVVARMWPKRLEALAIFCALGGAAILLGRSAEISHETLVGDFFSLAAGVMYVGYLIALKNARESLGAFSLLVWVSIFACPILLGVAILLGEPVMPGGAGWGPVVALALVSQIAGQGLLVFSMRYFSPLIIGLALLTQPAVAALSGYFIFGEVLGIWDIIGMALVGGALVLARLKQGG